jgi:hypothetical protein
MALLAMALMTLYTSLDIGHSVALKAQESLDTVFQGDTNVPVFQIGAQDSDDLERVLSLIESSTFIPPCKMHLTQCAVKELADGRPLCFMVLVLPVLEQAIRRLFAEVHQCPHILVAQDRMLFSTLDGFGQRNKHQVLLDPHVLSSGEENGIFKLFSNGITKCLLDQFMCSSGPCVRGKLSHGEIDYSLEFGLNNVPQKMSVSNIILYLLVALCCHFYGGCPHSSKMTGRGFEREHVLSNQKMIGKGVLYSGFVGTCCSWIESYESLFHPHAVLSQSMLSAAQKLLDIKTKWDTLPIKVLQTEKKEAGASKQVVVFTIADGTDSYTLEEKSSRYKDLGGLSSGINYRPHLAATFGSELDQLFQPLREGNTMKQMLLRPELPSFFARSMYEEIVEGKIDISKGPIWNPRTLSMLQFRIPDGPFAKQIPVIGCLQSLAIVCNNILCNVESTLEELLVGIRARTAQSSQRTLFVSTLLMLPIFRKVVSLIMVTIERHVYISCESNTTGIENESEINPKSSTRLLGWFESFSQCIVPPSDKWSAGMKRKSYEKAVEQAGVFLGSKMAKSIFKFNLPAS